jgi:transposase
MNGLDPEAYLRDIIARIADHPINRITELLPWNWRPTGGRSPPAQCASCRGKRVLAPAGTR